MVLVFTAAVFDLRTRRIPNWLVGLGLVTGVGMHSFVGGTEGLWYSSKGAGVALLIYFPLFALRAMGAGDGKLMAAVGSIVGMSNWLGIFFITAVVGGVLGVVVMIARKRSSKTVANILFILRELAHFRAPHQSNQELAVGKDGALSLPHGAVIAISSVIFLAAMITWAPR